MTNINHDKPRLHLLGLFKTRAQTPEIPVVKVVPPDPIDWARRRKEMAERQRSAVDSAPAKTSPSTTGARFKSFDNDRSVVEAVKVAMAEHPKDSVKASKSIGLDTKVYRLIVKLLTLRDRHIPNHHRKTIDKALEMIETTKRAVEARTLTRPLIEELWQSRDDGKGWRREKRFNQTLISIGESCESTKDMEIPRDLSPAAAREAVVTLAGSMELIARLMRRLLGEEL